VLSHPTRTRARDKKNNGQEKNTGEKIRKRGEEKKERGNYQKQNGRDYLFLEIVIHKFYCSCYYGVMKIGCGSYINEYKIVDDSWYRG
jgi:hypothetical protein